MALAGELVNYIGGDLVKNTGKELVSKATTSALSNLIPKLATNATNNMANKIGNEVIAGSMLGKLVPKNRMLDKFGKPVTLYHSTPNNFDKFDDAMLGSNTGYDNTALGHFVTPDKDFSKRFIDIDNVGKTGRTMELQANVKKPITHPYMAGYKYDNKDLDKIVEDYLLATDNSELLDELRYALDDNSNLYDEYMGLTMADSPFEVAGSDRQSLMNKGYDAVEIVEGPKSWLVEGSKDNSPVSSYAVFSGENLRPVRHIPLEGSSSLSSIIPVKRKLYRGQQYSDTDFSYNSELMNENPDKWGSKDELTDRFVSEFKQKAEKYMPKRASASDDDMVTLFHNTKAENIPSIMEQGLIPGKRPGGYLASPEEAGIWTDDRGLTSGSYGGTTVKIRVPKKEFDATRVNDTQNLLNRVIKPSEIEGVDYMLFDTPLIKNSNLQEYIDKYGENKVRELVEKKGLVSPEVIDRSFSDLKSGMSLTKPNIQQSKVELSPQQQEFFKDSVVRDKDGNLMPVFHTTTTNKRIDRFNADNGMVWVTPNKMYSTGFAGNGYNPNRTYELYANIKNPVYVGHIDPAINDSTIEKLSAYTGVDEESLLAIAEKYDARNIWKITNSKDFKELMQAKGYDGIEAREGGNQISYAAFSPEQVKRVGNLNPTSSPMIDKSLTEMAKRINAMKASSESMADGVKRIGSDDVAPVREDTLPDGWRELEKYLDTSNDRLSLEIGKPRSKITKQDLIDFLEENGYDTEGTKDELWKNALMCIDDRAVDELYEAGGMAGDFLQNRLPFRSAADMRDATHYYLGAKGRTGRLDAEYSDRLGIGRSHTPMSDNTVSWGNDAAGSYTKGGFGTNPNWATGESGVSTSAHERMHAWQDINKFDWDEEVGDAIDELRGELKKFYHDEDAIKKYWGNSKTNYYMEDIEQEARMLQSYLDNEGYTNTYRKTSEKGTEWGDEVKPAFDKFFKKLRELSKKGVALPAVAGLVGIGATANSRSEKSNKETY